MKHVLDAFLLLLSLVVIVCLGIAIFDLLVNKDKYSITYIILFVMSLVFMAIFLSHIH